MEKMNNLWNRMRPGVYAILEILISIFVYYVICRIMGLTITTEGVNMLLLMNLLVKYYSWKYDGSEITENDSPIGETIGDNEDTSKQDYAPRGRNKTYHPGLVGIDNLRQHYYMSEPYVVETCQKAGIHIEKIGKHWFVKKEDRQRVIDVCNLEPKEK